MTDGQKPLQRGKGGSVTQEPFALPFAETAAPLGVALTR